MSNVASPDVETASEVEHRLAVVNGLLAALDTPRGLDSARRLLNELELDEQGCAAGLRDIHDQLVEALKAKLAEADAKAETTRVAVAKATCPVCGAKKRKGKCPSCGAVPTTPGDSAQYASGQQTSSGWTDVANAGITYNALLASLGVEDTGAVIESKEPEMEEARVTGNPSVPGSPSSQTSAGAKQNEAWGGPNAGALAGLALNGPIMTRPPNLRAATSWSACANCVHWHKGCNLYGIERPPEDVIHVGQYPTELGDVCDSHMTLTPRSTTVQEAEALAERWERAVHVLAEAEESGDVNRAITAQVRVDGFAARLEEFGLHMPTIKKPFDEVKHPRVHDRRGGGEFAHKQSFVYAHPEGTTVIHDGKEHVVERSNQKTTQKTVRLKPKDGGPSVEVDAGTVVKTKQKTSRELDREMDKRDRSRGGDAAAVARHRREREEESRRRYAKTAEEAEVDELDEVKSSAYPGLDRSKKENWVDKAGGLPSYISRIAKHLHYEKGKEIGHAIAIAVNVVKKMCASGDTNFPGKQNVKASSRAQACAAVAQWEAKKAKSKGKSVAEALAAVKPEFAELVETVYEHWESTPEFDDLVAAVEEAYKPVPPSFNFIEAIHTEIALIEANGNWMDGYAEEDLQEGIFDTMRRRRIVANEVRDRRGQWAASGAKHPRLTHELKKIGGLTDPRSGGADKRGGAFTGRVASGAREQAGEVFTAVRGKTDAKERARQLGSAQAIANHLRTRASMAHLGVPDSESEYGSAYASQMRKEMRKRAGPGVEAHFAVANQRSPGADTDEDLTVDHAIGEVLANFPGVKDWKVTGPETDGDKQRWRLHVDMGDAKHEITVAHDGEVKYEKGPMAGKKPPAKQTQPPAPKQGLATSIVDPKPTLAGEYVATGDVNVISHMAEGTVYKGKDGVLYKHHGDEWIMGKKGKVKGAHVENLKTGTHKVVPYFTVHGVEYEIHAPAGSFTPKAPDAPSSADDVFSQLMKSVEDQHGSVTSVAGKNIAVTGTIPGHARDAVFAMLSAKGATPHKSVTNATDVLITGGAIGKNKIADAKKKNVMVIPWEEISHLVEGELIAEFGPDFVKLIDTWVELAEAVDVTALIRLRAREDALARRMEEAVYTAAEHREKATIKRDGGKFPIGDKAHARAAIARINQSDLSPEEKAKVLAKARRVLAGKVSESYREVEHLRGRAGKWAPMPGQHPHHQAFHEIIGGKAYFYTADNKWHYNSSVAPGAPVTPWSDAVKAEFGDDHKAVRAAANDYIRPISVRGH